MKKSDEIGSGEGRVPGGLRSFARDPRPRFVEVLRFAGILSLIYAGATSPFLLFRGEDRARTLGILALIHLPIWAGALLAIAILGAAYLPIRFLVDAQDARRAGQGLWDPTLDGRWSDGRGWTAKPGSGLMAWSGPDPPGPPGARSP